MQRWAPNAREDHPGQLRIDPLDFNMNPLCSVLAQYSVYGSYVAF
jgi:hypothetical protein